MHFKSCQLRQRQREYCKPRSLQNDCVASSSWSPPDCSPHLHLKSRLGRGFLIHQHLASDLGTRSAWRSRSAARSSSVPMCPPRTSWLSCSLCCTQAPWTPHVSYPCSHPQGSWGKLRLPCTPSTLQLECRALHLAWPRKSPSLPLEPLWALGFPFSGPSEVINTEGHMLIRQSPLITSAETEGLFVQNLQRLSPRLRDLSHCITNGVLVSSSAPSGP